MSKKLEQKPKGPELIGHTSLMSDEGNRFKFKYLALADLHPFYDHLIEQNSDDLLQEAKSNGDTIDVTERFKEEALRLFEEKNK